MDAVHCRDLHEEAYVNRANCEYYEYAGNILRGLGVYVKVVMRSDRDDWVQAMILAGLGFGFFSEYSVTMPGIVTKPLIEPEFVRQINLVTVRGRPHSPAVGALRARRERLCLAGRSSRRRRRQSVKVRAASGAAA